MPESHSLRLGVDSLAIASSGNTRARSIRYYSFREPSLVHPLRGPWTRPAASTARATPATIATRTLSLQRLQQRASSCGEQETSPCDGLLVGVGKEGVVGFKRARGNDYCSVRALLATVSLSYHRVRGHRHCEASAESRFDLAPAPPARSARTDSQTLHLG